MTAILFLETHLTLYYVLIGLVSLCVGSFLNVVIARYPKMLDKQWREQCQDYLGIQTDFEPSNILNLCFPRSHCPQCQKTIAWYDNIPLLSFLWLRTRCRYCQVSISYRYFFVELLTAFLSVLIATQFGVSCQTLFMLVLLWVVIAMSVIDIDYQILPDSMTLSMLWLGLLVNTMGLYASLPQAVWGAVLGYLSFYLIAALFKLCRKKEGMGQGDFKLLACFGAWLGWPMLPVMILIASLSALVVGVGVLLIKRQSICTTPIPFGPFLALGGMVCLVYHPLLF